ncbi:MAG: hypothetical protein KGQ89_06925, partial [Verrucomicrobia bacterium]|nr:hypothetical protein [Verrucomicrobiota bacterium]
VMKASMAGDTVLVMGELNPFARVPASTDMIRQTANMQRRSLHLPQCCRKKTDPVSRVGLK